MSMIAGLASIPPDRLEALQAAPDTLDEIVFAQDEQERERQIDLDKAWHGIHFLLTGKAWGGEGPLAWAVVGGHEIGDDIGYGPARFLTPEQVGQVAAALAAVTGDEFARRYDPAAMEKQQIYPGIWEREGDEGLAWLRHYLPVLGRFYADAAGRGDAVLLWLS